MTPHYKRRAKPPNPPTDEILGKSRRDHRWFLPVLTELKEIFPRKLAQELALIANRSERVCEDWIARKGAPDGEALSALLNSRIGDRLFLALTRSSPHGWRKDLNRQIKMSQLRVQQRATALELEALERGEP